MQSINHHKLVATLKKNKVVVTNNRLAVLTMLYQHPAGINVSRLRKSSLQTLDRISIYRTLQIFLKKGIVLMVPNTKGDPQYVLNDFFNDPGFSSKNKFAYFVCKSCGYTELIQQPNKVNLKIPDSHLINKYYIVLEGVCKSCKEK